MVHIYCGDGKGKTTAAAGLAVRSAGSGNRVLFVQFFKDGTSSEVDVLNSIEGIDCRFYPVLLGFYKGMTEDKKKTAAGEYQKLLEDTINSSQDYDTIILDEIISTYNYGMVDHQLLIDFLKDSGCDKEIVMTGREPASELIELADYVSEIRKIKHPYDNGVIARKGVEY